VKKAVGVFLADVHWTMRTPEYRRETRPFSEVIGAKLRLPLAFASENGIPVFFGGDLFDRSREFMDMWTLVDFLSGFGQLPSMRVVAGQHDRFHHNAEDRATSLEMSYRACVDMRPLGGEGLRLPYGRGVSVYGCGWNDGIPEPTDALGANILVAHKTLWCKTPPYPGLKNGNVMEFGAKAAKLGYSIVFSGDNHKAFDAETSGVRFYNLGCFTRDDVRYRDQRPRYCVLFDDLSVESVFVGEEDVFEIGRSDADKGRDDRNDEFSAALAGGFERGATFKSSLSDVAEAGRCGGVELTGRQTGILKDVINAI